MIGEPLLIQHAVTVAIKIDRSAGQVKNVIVIIFVFGVLVSFSTVMMFKESKRVSVWVVVIGLLLRLLMFQFLSMLFFHELLLKQELLLLVFRDVVNGESDGVEGEAGF